MNMHKQLLYKHNYKLLKGIFHRWYNSNCIFLQEREKVRKKNLEGEKNMQNILFKTEISL